ncbi:AMP-binding protein, partial [Caballeronia sp. M23-90]
MHCYSDYFPHRHPQDELDCVALLAAGLFADPARIFLHYENRTIRCDEAVRHIGQLQAWFKHTGIEQGDRVAVMLGNSPEHIYLIYALILSGVVWVPVNTRLRGTGLEYLLQHAEPKLFVFDQEFDAVTAQIDCGEARRERVPDFAAHAATATLRTPA